MKQGSNTDAYFCSSEGQEESAKDQTNLLMPFIGV